MKCAKIIVLTLMSILVLPVYSQKQNDNGIADFRKKLSAELKRDFEKYNLPSAARVDTVYLNGNGELVIGLNRRSSGKVIREDNVTSMTKLFTDFKNANGFSKQGLKILMGPFELKEMVPNYFRDKSDKDKSRYPVKNESFNLVTKEDRPFKIEKGLDGKNIVVWNSHGWYYSNEDDRWQWQRARLWGTVEDLLTTSIVVPYLVPMLENAGAGVFLPRERDFQLNEVVVDNDNISANGGVEINSGWEKTGSGFRFQVEGYEANINPFGLGTFLKTKSVQSEKNPLFYIPEIPETGEYAVYVSYGKDAGGKNVPDVTYTVYHAGGTSTFTINQNAGWGTWVYLGTFKFKEGKDKNSTCVKVSDKSNSEGFITSDAVRFGGGMGVVKRNGKTSGRPKFAEGARYFLQYLGVNDTLVYNIHKNIDDYTDDYRARGEYVNWLNGSPAGPNKNRSEEGLKIPIDLSLAWHTDAGILGGDSVVGTLMIYSSVGMDTSYFPGGRSRMANRDLADVVQSQIVDDIKALFDRKWTRRELMDANYAEAVRGNVPGILLELLSHQNYAEMKFFWQPSFKFAVSRAIYKGMLRFINSSTSSAPVIQPLPVNNFSALLDGESASLKWKPVSDPLEPSAAPSGYVVYRRIGDGGFDNGRYSATANFIDKQIPKGVVVSYKVTAVNSGGESFPSEILSVGIGEKKGQNILIVNAFDRLDAPKVIDKPGFEGFLFNFDEGVQLYKDVAFVGEQVDFNRTSDFKSNDAPGFGASKSNLECKIIAGNTFDYTSVHGEAILSAGYSFSSSSDESVESGEVSISSYNFLDIVAGEEKTSEISVGLDPVKSVNYKLFTPALTKLLTTYLSKGNALFISGSYIGSELEADSSTLKFGSGILKTKLGTHYASTSGKVFGVDSSGVFAGEKFEFNTGHSDKIYRVEAPEAMNPEKESETLLRYTENTNSAVVGYRGLGRVVVAGFPFETIQSIEQRNKFMNNVLEYLGIKQ